MSPSTGVYPAPPQTRHFNATYANAASTGSLVVSTTAAISAGGNGIFATSNARGGISITTATGGTISAGTNGILATQTGAVGAVSISTQGDIGGPAGGALPDPVGVDGINAQITSGANGDALTVTANNNIWALDDGIQATHSGTGATTVNFGTAAGGTVAIVAGDRGIDAKNIGGGAGSVTVNLGDTGAGTVTRITAANEGVHAESTGTGDVTIATGDSVAIDPVDYGLFAKSALGDATITTGASNSFTVGDTDADGIAVGLYAESGRAVGDPSVEVTLGISNTITVNDGAGVPGATNEGVGILAIDSALGGAGSVKVITGNGLAINVDSDNGQGINAATLGGGNVSVTTGTGSITLTGGNGADPFVGFNRAAGIAAITAGMGSASVTNNAVVTVANGGALPVVGISAIAGTGGVSVTTNANVTGTAGIGVQTVSGAGGTINIGAAATVAGGGTGPTSWVIDATTAAANTTTINNAGTIRSTDATTAGYDDLAVIGRGAGSTTVNNTGRINGVVNFSANASSTVNNTAGGADGWHTSGTSTFSGGNDLVNNTGAGTIFTSGTTTFAFGADTAVAPRDRLNNTGTIIAGELAGASTFSLTGLETWDNGGVVFFGSTNGVTSDNETNDRIVASGSAIGTRYTGSAGSLFVLDATLGSATQTSCAAASVADCLSILSGTTAGAVTNIRVNDTNTVAATFNPVGIVLVDVNGGTSSAAAFELDPGSEFYVVKPVIGPVLDKGFFFYDLVYDSGNQRHLLVGIPDAEAFEFTAYGTAASNLWYDATGTWFDRQADMRASLNGRDAGWGPAIWLRALGSWADRDVSQSFTLLGNVYTFDTSHHTDTAGLVGGIDLMRSGGGAGPHYVFGVTGGYVDSDIRFDNTSTTANLAGMTLGAYATYMNGGFFLDGVFNANFLKLDITVPTIPQPPNLFTTSGDVTTYGGQLEAGYQFGMGSSWFWEPVASLAYVTTSFDDLAVPGGSVVFDDATSFRGSLGLRLGTTADMQNYRVRAVVTARVWDEFQGQNDLVINTGTAFAMTDDFQGIFGDVGLGLNLFSSTNGLSAFLNGNYRWNSDWQSTAVTAGFRYQW